jgi:hypothetical protein
MTDGASNTLGSDVLAASHIKTFVLLATKSDSIPELIAVLVLFFRSSYMLLADTEKHGAALRLHQFNTDVCARLCDESLTPNFFAEFMSLATPVLTRQETCAAFFSNVSVAFENLAVEYMINQHAALSVAPTISEGSGFVLEEMLARIFGWAIHSLRKVLWRAQLRLTTRRQRKKRECASAAGLASAQQGVTLAERRLAVMITVLNTMVMPENRMRSIEEGGDLSAFNYAYANEVATGGRLAKVEGGAQGKARLHFARKNIVNALGSRFDKVVTACYSLHSTFLDTLVVHSTNLVCADPTLRGKFGALVKQSMLTTIRTPIDVDVDVDVDVPVTSERPRDNMIRFTAQQVRDLDTNSKSPKDRALYNNAVGLLHQKLFTKISHARFKCWMRGNAVRALVAGVESNDMLCREDLKAQRGKNVQGKKRKKAK